MSCNSGLINMSDTQKTDPYQFPAPPILFFRNPRLSPGKYFNNYVHPPTRNDVKKWRSKRCFVLYLKKYYEYKNGQHHIIDLLSVTQLLQY